MDSQGAVVEVESWVDFSVSLSYLCRIDVRLTCGSDKGTASREPDGNACIRAATTMHTAEQEARSSHDVQNSNQIRAAGVPRHVSALSGATYWSRDDNRSLDVPRMQ